MWTPLRQAAPAPAHGLFMFVTIVMAPTPPDSWAAITKSGHSLPVTTNQFEAQLRQPLSEQTTPVAFHKRFFPRPNFALSIFLPSRFCLLVSISSFSFAGGARTGSAEWGPKTEIGNGRTQKPPLMTRMNGVPGLASCPYS